MTTATVANPSMQTQAREEISEVALGQAMYRLATASGVLAIELRDDPDTCRMGEELDVDALAALATNVASAGRLVLAQATRTCERCGDPLLTIEDRKIGRCEPCREERKARRAIAARQGGAR